MPGNVPTMSVPYPHPLFGVDTILGAGFNGTDTYLTRGADLTGNVDSQVITIAFKTRMSSAGYVFESTSNRMARVNIINNASIQILGANAAGSLVYNWNATGFSPVLDDGNYHTVLFSVSLPATEIAHFVIDDTEITYSANFTVEDETIDYTVADHVVGAAFGLGSKYSGDIEMFWLDNVYYDFSVEANRRKFFDASGDAVLDPTGDGTPAGGAQPLIYLAGTFDQWEENKGTGGGMTVTGALTEPAD